MSAIWVATWVMLLSKNHLPSGTVFNRVACATTWGQDDMIGFVVVLQPGYVVISMAHVANNGPKKPCPWTASCGRAGVCEICAGTMSTSVACAAFCIHDIIQRCLGSGFQHRKVNSASYRRTSTHTFGKACLTSQHGPWKGDTFSHLRGVVLGTLTDQLSCHPGTYTGLGIDTHQHLPRL